jgi:hypothetical protein
MTLLHSVAYCRARRLYLRPFLSATSTPRSSESDWPSSTFLLSNLRMMHSQLDFDAPPDVHKLMKPLCASMGYSYLPWGGDFGAGLMRNLCCGTLFVVVVGWGAGCAGALFCPCVVVGFGVVGVVLCVAGCVGVPVGPVVPPLMGVRARVATHAAFFVEPQPLAASTTGSSKQMVKRSDLCMTKSIHDGRSGQDS